MRRNVDWYIAADVSERFAASILRIQVFDLNYSDPHDGVSKLLKTKAIYKSTRRHISEELNSHQQRCAKLSLVSILFQM
jgi:hypothetical protein